jgi:hypothetical protein
MARFWLPGVKRQNNVGKRSITDSAELYTPYLGDLASSTGSGAFVASSNGSVVVGKAPQGANSVAAFRWTARRVWWRCRCP